MAMLFRMVLIAGFLQIASGCTNFGQAKMQRVQMPVANDNRSVSLDEFWQALRMPGKVV